MANKSAWLTKRVKLDGKWMTKPPVFNKRMLTDKILVDGEHRLVRGTFCIEWYQDGRRMRKTVGRDPSNAHLELQRKLRRLADLAEGLPVIEPSNETRHAYDIAVAEYVVKLREKEREPKTIRGIEQVLDAFHSATGRTYLEEISAEDVTVKFVAALRKDGYARQTVFDRYARMIAFLNFCQKKYGVAKVAQLKDGPDRPKARVSDDGGRKDPYTAEELKRLFEVCTPEENLIWTFFLQTGCRERELMYATWRDINVKDRVFHIRDKAEYGFRTKDRTDRSVPFGQALADALGARKAESKSALVFPDRKGNPRFHIIRVLKKRALQAGLNCAHCLSSKGESCAEKPVCGNWFLHKFRHTFAAMHLRNGVDVRTLQAWLGHEELETTSIYLAKLRNTSEKTKAMVDAAFSGIAGEAAAELTGAPSNQQSETVATVQASFVLPNLTPVGS